MDYVTRRPRATGAIESTKSGRRARPAVTLAGAVAIAISTLGTGSAGVAAAEATEAPTEVAGIHVIADLGGRRAGAWLGSSGERITTERSAMRGPRLMSACPGGELLVEVIRGEPLVQIRDLGTLETVSTIDPQEALTLAGVSEDAPPEDVVCRSADATDIVYRWGTTIRDASGREIAWTAAWQEPSAMDDRIAVGAVSGGRAAEIVDLASGRVGRLTGTEGRQRITGVAISPSGDTVALIISDRDRDIARLVEVSGFVDPAASAMADVRLINLSSDAAWVDLETATGDSLIGRVAAARAGWGRVESGPQALRVRVTDPEESLLEVGNVELAPGPSTSIIVTGSAADGTLSASVVADTDANRDGADSGTAVTRVLNGLGTSIDLEVREQARRRGGERVTIPIEGLASDAASEYRELADDLRLSLAGGSPADVSTPGIPGAAYTIALAPAADAANTEACAAEPSTSGCVALLVFRDRPSAPAGTELASGRITWARELENTPLWVDDDTLAIVLHHQLGVRDKNPGAGAVTLHDGADLTPLCTWSGWDARPVASADGVLFGWRPAADPKRPVAVGARGGKDRRLGEINAIPFLGIGDSIVPLPALDGSMLTGAPDASCDT